MLHKFTAPDWPLTTVSATDALQDPVPITIVNQGQHSLWISFKQAGGSKNEKSVPAGKQWDVVLKKGGCSEYWGFFGKGGMVPNTVLTTAS